MKVINAGYKILTPIDREKVLEFIKIAGTTCYQSYEWTNKTSSEFTTSLVNRGHMAMIEHAPSLSVVFTVDRGVSHEMVRHRLFSFAQESTRYVNYNKVRGSYDGEIQFIKPCFWDEGSYLYELWYEQCKTSEITYKKMIENGAKPEEARSVLPNSLKTEIVITGNLREWYHFFSLRCASTAHIQMREVAIPLFLEIHKIFPELFDKLYKQLSEQNEIILQR